MKTDIWMPIYLGDYFKDTRHFSTEEHGAYLLILMELWVKEGKIPENTVYRVAGSPENWTEIQPNIYNLLTIKNGIVSQKRLTKELVKWKKFRKIRQKAGKLGGRPRKPIGSVSDNLKVKPSPSPSSIKENTLIKNLLENDLKLTDEQSQ